MRVVARGVRVAVGMCRPGGCHRLRAGSLLVRLQVAKRPKFEAMVRLPYACPAATSSAITIEASPSWRNTVVNDTVGNCDRSKQRAEKKYGVS